MSSSESLSFVRYCVVGCYGIEVDMCARYVDLGLDELRLKCREILCRLNLCEIELVRLKL